MAERNARLAPDSGVLAAADVDAPLALCSAQGELLMATPRARSLLRELGLSDVVPGPLPEPLWSALEGVELGEAIEWWPGQGGGALLGCSRHALARGGFLLLMREVSQKVAALEEAQERRRVAATGRLLASVAHDVRSSAASIVYSADFLDRGGVTVKPYTLRETLADICEASRRLQLTVDALLDYARLGPAILVPVSLREVLNRAQGLLRSFYRDGAHRLQVEVGREADWVRGNPVIIEQIFVNLLLSAVECAERPCLVTVHSECAAEPSSQGGRVLIHVGGDGLALLESTLGTLMDRPSSRAGRSAVALADARAAAVSQAGELLREARPGGPRVTVSLPRSEGPR